MDEQLKKFIKQKSQQIIISKQHKTNLTILDQLQYSLIIKLSVVIKNQTNIDIKSVLNSYIIPINEDIVLEVITDPPEQSQSNIISCQSIEYIGQSYLSPSNTNTFIKCSSQCQILVIKEGHINNIISIQLFKTNLDQYYRITEESTIFALQKIYFLQNMSEGFFCSVVHQSDRRNFIRGQKIYSLGDEVDRFCLLLNGEVSIKTNIRFQNSTSEFDEVCDNKKIWAQFGRKSLTKQQELIIKTIVSGQCFGEVELFQQQAIRQQYAECKSLSCEVLVLKLEIILKELKNFTKNENITLSSLSDKNLRCVNLKNNNSLMREQTSQQILTDFASQNMINLQNGLSSPKSSQNKRLKQNGSLKFIVSQSTQIQSQIAEEKCEFTFDFNMLKLNRARVEKDKFQLQKMRRSQSTMTQSPPKLIKDSSSRESPISPFKISQNSPSKNGMFIHKNYIKLSKFQRASAKHGQTVLQYIEKFKDFSGQVKGQGFHTPQIQSSLQQVSPLRHQTSLISGKQVQNYFQIQPLKQQSSGLIIKGKVVLQINPKASVGDNERRYQHRSQHQISLANL